MTQASDATPLDGRGSELSHRYRQLPADSVPEDLDRLILEHARAAVDASAPRRTWIRWGLPLGLIGSAVLAATLVLEGSHPPQQLSIAQAHRSRTEIPERPEVPERSTARPTGAASSATPRTATFAPAVPPKPVAPAIAPRRAESPPAPMQISAPVPASTPPQAQAAVVAGVAPEPASAATPQSEPPSQAAPLSAAPAEPLEQSAGTAAEETAPQTPASQSPFEALDALQLSTTSPAKQPVAEERLEDIRYLRQTGRNRRADYEWRKFLEDFPNYPVAADDRARPRAR